MKFNLQSPISRFKMYNETAVEIFCTMSHGTKTTKRNYETLLTLATKD